MSETDTPRKNHPSEQSRSETITKDCENAVACASDAPNRMIIADVYNSLQVGLRCFEKIYGTETHLILQVVDYWISVERKLLATTSELTAARAEIEILNEKLSQHKQSLVSTDIHNSEIAVKLEQVTEQRDRLEMALNHATGVITVLGEVEP